MSVDLTSLVQCRNLYLDYYYKGNKAGTKVSDIKLIEQEYSDYLTKWSAIGKSSEDDTNEYAIGEDEWELYENDGKKQAEDVTGYTKGSSGNGWKIAGNGAFAGAAAGVSFLGGNSATVTVATQQIADQVTKKVTKHATKQASKAMVKEAAKNAAKESLENSTKKGFAKGVDAIQNARAAATETSKNIEAKGLGEVNPTADSAANEAGKNAGSGVKDATWLISIPLELASAILALATDANGKEADALAELTGQMQTAQGDLTAAQSEMEAAATAVAEKEQEFLDINEESSNQMITLQTKTDALYQMYTNLKNKEARGVTLTDGEKYLLAACAANIESNNTSQDSIQAAAENAKVETTAEIETKNAVYDAAGTTIAETQGMTDYGASFDKSTKVLCYVTMACDALNIGMAIKDGWRAFSVATSGSWAFGATAWAWAFVAMAAAAGVMSGFDIAHQVQHIKTVNEEIGTRETTQEYTENVMGTYDADITEFDGSMQSMSEQEILDLQKKEVSSTT